MKKETTATLLDFAVETAQLAGRESLRHFGGRLDAALKDDDTPVTVADRAVERAARERIQRYFPHDGVLGEEFGTVRAQAGRRWILDPIDGTISFMRGVPLYATLIALEEADEAVLGVIHLPALGETVAAVRGEGCWWDGHRTGVSETAAIADATIVTTDTGSIQPGRTGGWDRLRTSAGIVRTWGDAYGYALVATGRAEAMLDPVLAIWDVAPVAPIISEAGGVLTGWDGGTDWPMRNAVATNAALAEQVRGLLRGDPVAWKLVDHATEHDRS